MNGVKTIAHLAVCEVVSIDGKTVRPCYGKGKKGKGQGAIHTVSAWARENRLVLGQIKIDDKSDEITAIPKLLDALGVSGCVVTIDAMGAQKEIAKLITDQSADYVLSLEGNQGNLHEDV